ncbi:sigma-54-dependent transcriptional regulator [Oceanospirillum sanctuarii]|uniref:sigma-54-dependent transcriptional regulator n=1 Tax=Oceanospirillum sanctuarii TaxID=1434821 RepID=UPI000A37DA8A|nr:sigma-54 dependent transcriptional regulator [Oceanospirillum sanctuarii]
MNPKDLSILVVEDSPTLAGLYQSYLETEHFSVTLAETGTEALQLLKDSLFDGVLLDLLLPDMNGIEVLKYISEQELPSATIIITAHGSVETAVETMHYGALDYLEKPFDSSRLITTVRNALKSKLLEKQLQSLQDSYERSRFAGFVGRSIAMQRVYSIIESAAPSKATVFVTGESGTGKEVCAEAIHQLSPRAKQPFIALNCGAIPKDLIESEIFGHVKGAFTGAVSPRQGAAEQADGGTLFLDEICEMDLELQVKLLRFIQTGTFQKVGSSNTQKVDVRFVCATNRDPLKEVEAGRFREDLYYRLHVIPISLPALRERDADVILLARHFLKKYAEEENKAFDKFSPEAEVILNSFDWPGNIRQLQNVIRNMIVLNDGDTISAEMLPPPLNDLDINIEQKVRQLQLQEAAYQAEQAALLAKETASQVATEPVTEGTAVSEAANHSGSSVVSGTQDKAGITVAVTESAAPGLFQTPDDIRPLWIIEKEIIEKAIELCDDNIPKAAARLEISPSTIYRKKQSWDSMMANIDE